jgi:hypothetical protein
MFRDQENSTAKTADFAPVSKRHFLKTAAAIAAGAAVSGTRAFAAELFITNNKAAPEIPVQRKFELLNLA